MMSMQNSWTPTRNATNSQAAPLAAKFTLVHGSTRCSEKSFGCGRAAVGARDERVDVEDQGDPPVAENRRRGDARHLAIIRFEALDDDLSLIVDRVDDEGAARAHLRLDDENDAADRISRGLAVAEFLSDVDQRREPAAIRNDPRIEPERVDVASSSA